MAGEGSETQQSMAPLYNHSMAANRPQFFDPATEQGVLRLSTAASLLLAAAAVVFGLLAHSCLLYPPYASD
ncbi:cation diffusion facilitator family transporter, partial [Stenotrophomonas muris]